MRKKLPYKTWLKNVRRAYKKKQNKVLDCEKYINMLKGMYDRSLSVAYTYDDIVFFEQLEQNYSY